MYCSLSSITFNCIVYWNVAAKQSVLNAMNPLMVLWNYPVVMCCASSASFSGRSWNFTFVRKQSVKRNFHRSSKLKLLPTKSKYITCIFLFMCVQVCASETVLSSQGNVETFFGWSGKYLYCFVAYAFTTLTANFIRIDQLLHFWLTFYWDIVLEFSKNTTFKFFNIA